MHQQEQIQPPASPSFKPMGKTWYCPCGAAIITVWNDKVDYMCRRCGRRMSQNPEETRRGQ